ncbi:hypothetical protein HHL16_07965 [Pseudoflavitalea sp. G-6-1-2]|uniref:hypothetical protein n=1 Tax=Pseudoflavitalea sp. G-6-1-2 TaxID=2728841 RepID=UPI001469F864|nr:hypothetical protein [Pseudoflavitalea sp. G-6-1-2]NML20805.1 hypothetical protein [Pseudoflavitalea sp. G-6-1-2]
MALLLSGLIISLQAAAWQYGEHLLIGDIAFARFMFSLNSNKAASGFLSVMNCMSDSSRQRFFFPAWSSGHPVSYGVLNALSGDHVADPFLMDEQLRSPTSVLQRIMHLHQTYIQMGFTAAPDNKLVKTDFNYLLLAASNLPHFYEYNRNFRQQLQKFDTGLVRLCQSPAGMMKAIGKLNKSNALNMYATMHLAAMELAATAGAMINQNKEEAALLLQYAFLLNGFADHFLEDAFSSGHLVVNRNLFASVTNNKPLHDFYSAIGTTVVNRKGQIWKAFGDGNFNNRHHAWQAADDIRDISYAPFTTEAERVIESVRLSIEDLYLAFTGNEEAVALLHWPASSSGYPDHLIKHLRSFSLVPIPYNTKPETVMPDQISITADMRKASSLLPQRNFIRSRIANSFVFCINSEAFNGSYYRGGEVRLNFGSLLNKYRLNKKGEKSGTLDYWNGYTFSFSYGNYGITENKIRVRKEVSYQFRAGIRSNVDFWISNKRFIALYSYTEAGIQFVNGKGSFVFVPGIGFQPGALLNWNYYNMSPWWRIPAQYFLPLKIRYGMVISPAGEPKFFSGIDIDFVF